MSGTLLVGLTGGIGSGKSTVARMLSNLGALIIDSDAIARSVTAPGGAAIAAIGAEFGPDFVTADGALDRDRMRERAFQDAGSKRRLEAIIHPLVGQITAKHAQNAIDEKHPCVVFDIPLLVESGHWRLKLHRIIVVDCAEETQVQRVMARNGMARADVLRIMASQAKKMSRLSAADIVICNEHLSFESLGREVAQLADSFGLSLENRN